jgi:hypothetical protein
MPTPDPYGQGIQIAQLTDAPNAQTLAQALAGLASLVPKTILTYASASARAAALASATAPVAGMMTWLTDVARFEYYDGTAWQNVEPPHVQTTNPTVNLPSATTAYTALNLGSVLTSNRSDMFDAGHPTRLVAPLPGTYAVNGFLVWQGTLGTAEGRGEFRLNGTSTQAPAARFNITRGSGGNAAGVASGVLVFPAPGYAEVYANQNSGATTTLTTAVGMRRISASI